MNIAELLPTKKVTAYLVGGAVTIAGFWLLITLDVLADWPETFVIAAWALIGGFILAWIVPEGVWGKVNEDTSE